MSKPWYEIVQASVPLTQGDLLDACPLIGWSTQPLSIQAVNESEVLKGATRAFQADVVVMTQACDLEHDKIANIILCPHTSLDEYMRLWEEAKKGQGQNPTSKAWKAHCDDIREGFLWNLAMLNAGHVGPISAAHRIVDFHEVFTVPRTFLESWLRQRGRPRLRLLPPYREHLSQAFARFFMRVGLPTPVAAAW